MSLLLRRVRASSQTRLVLETLESREGPSSVLFPPGIDLFGPVAQPVPPGVEFPGQQNQRPVISDFRAAVGAGGAVTFTGRVSDDQAVAGLVVTITGGGFSATAIVDGDGLFRVTSVVPGTGTVTVTAQVIDALGLASHPVQTSFTR